MGCDRIQEPDRQTKNVGMSVPGCDSDCQNRIHLSRTKVAPIEANEVRYVLKIVQDEYSANLWQARLKTCLDKWEYFERAQRVTMYPAGLLAGKAYVEGAGCRFLRSGDGGYGPMQITSPTARHVKDVATMLGLKASNVKWKEDYWHNVLLGAVMLSDFENEFESRGVGIFAYNSGPGATRKYMRKANIKDFTGRTISDFRGAIPTGFSDGARPRIYLDRVLAGAVLVQRAKNGQPTTGIKRLELHDIPGAVPVQDNVQ